METVQEVSPSLGPAQRAGTRELRMRIFKEASAIVYAESSRELTIDEVARRVATSPRQLQRAFSEVSGLNFRAYLARVRMERAAALLADTDLPIKDVARRVGYRDPSQFTKAFKREHGATPSEIRLGATRQFGSHFRPSG